MKDDDGKIVVEEDKLMEVWRAHYDEITNEEFAWDRNGLTNVSPVCGPCERISALEVGVAIGKMKQGKSAGPTEVVAEMLKAAGETGTLWMTEVCNAVVKDGRVPEDWSSSWMVNVKYIRLLKSQVTYPTCFTIKVQVIQNTTHRPSTQASYTIGSGTTMQENQQAAQIAAKHSIIPQMAPYMS